VKNLPLTPAITMPARFNSLACRSSLARKKPGVSIELLILAASIFFTLFCNQLFWPASLAGRSWTESGTWLFAGSIFFIVTAIHSFLLGLVVNRWTAKPLLNILLIVTAIALYYMNTYTVFFDPSMMRNIFHTDVKEARELLTWSMIGYMLFFGVIPSLLIARLPLQTRPWKEAVMARGVFLLGSASVAAVCTILNFQDLSALMRNHKEVRYLVTPENFIVSSVKTLLADSGNDQTPRIPVGTDARLSVSSTQWSKPALFVIVVGETARSANWGLNGYERQTTPHMARAEVINFPHVESCGTNTEVSVPCMFSPFGRSHYNEEKIRKHESLLHVLEHAGIKTLWRDNQSGCKGVCKGLEIQRLDESKEAGLCDGDHCLDEILLSGLEQEIGKHKGENLVVVLHQLGNHGPSYSHRYPERFRQFIPTCEHADLGKCTRQEIVNSYDNALLYTDYFLDRAIGHLKAQSTHRAAMLYVSDHGESLGENGIYLHGLPYAIAPREQTQVPMLMWMDDRFASSFGIDRNCLGQMASGRINHDYLFHSLLGILGVDTKVYDKKLDFSSECRTDHS
jgi:lipid A ethanolaminephosphotransferase